MNQSPIRLTLQIAATYIGTVIGAGFATGKEIVTFFSLYGTYGSLFIIIAGTLFSWLGTKMMLIAYDHGTKTPLHFNRLLLGERVGSVVNTFIMVLLVGVTSVMLAGAGAVFKEQLHLPKQIGILVMIVLTLYFLFRGIHGVLKVNSIVVPFMILFSVGTSVTILITSENFTFFPSVTETMTWHHFMNPFTYAAFNLTLAQGVLVPLGANVGNRDAIKWGGIIGGVVLTIILLCGHLAISTVPNFMRYEIPMAEVVKLVHIGFHFVFVSVILGEIFTTLVGNLYGLVEQLTGVTTLSFSVAVTLILCICYGISFFDYHHLLTFLYPLFGWLSLSYLPLLSTFQRFHPKI